MLENLEFGLLLTFVGLVIVFAVLALIAGIVTLIGKLDKRWQEDERRWHEEAVDRTPTIDATTAVLIAAAVATYLGGRARIRTVRRLLPADMPSSPWSAQGRATLQGSHVISREGGR